ncbi:hypothetical protein DH2020_005536 [Rehmannia glutinosa]|uniref:Ankyrin repeat-containing protein n=1 Tax=Rehmannia glutinosa TaxID=99300 RepID=A0ABR0XGE2_REHGL
MVVVKMHAYLAIPNMHYTFGIKLIIIFVLAPNTKQNEAFLKHRRRRRNHFRRRDHESEPISRQKTEPRRAQPTPRGPERKQYRNRNSACQDRQTARPGQRKKAGFTPLHFAVKINTCLDVVARFLLDCPDSIDDLNNRSQTAVHVALESNNCDAAILLVNWLVRRSRENVVGWRDDKGNTALHVAVQYDCVQAVKTMLNIAKLNKRNSEGKTALDIAEDHKEEIAKDLEKAGARRARELPLKQPLNQYLLSQPTYMENLVRGFHFMIADLTNDMRNVVLVVAALIATATYQAFMPANTVAFTLSMVMIIFVLHGRPYNIILHMCLFFWRTAMSSPCPSYPVRTTFRYHVHRVVVRDRDRLRGEDVVLCGESVVRGCVVAHGCPDAAWYGPTFFIE